MFENDDVDISTSRKNYKFNVKTKHDQTQIEDYVTELFNNDAYFSVWGSFENNLGSEGQVTRTRAGRGRGNHALWRAARVPLR